MGDDNVVEGRILTPEASESEFDDHGCSWLELDSLATAARALQDEMSLPRP